MATLEQMAEVLGITPDQLEKRVRAGIAKRFAPVVSEGKITFHDDMLIHARRCRAGSIGVIGHDFLDTSIVVEEFTHFQRLFGDDDEAIRRVVEAYGSTEVAVHHHLRHAGLPVKLPVTSQSRRSRREEVAS